MENGKVMYGSYHAGNDTSLKIKPAHLVYLRSTIACPLLENWAGKIPEAENVFSPEKIKEILFNYSFTPGWLFFFPLKLESNIFGFEILTSYIWQCQYSEKTVYDVILKYISCTIYLGMV